MFGMKKLKELYQYREMINSSIKKELDAAYRRSTLGTLWLFLNPLLQLLVYNIVFSEILQIQTENYLIFLASGLMPWIFFSSTITGGARCILNEQDIVKKNYFPREIAPISYTVTTAITMILSIIVIYVLLILLGVEINLNAIIYLPILIIIEFFFALGIVLIVSALTVYFRDMEFILGILTMAWQFLTPVMYPVDIVPEALQPIWRMNPMTPIIEGYRTIMYDQKIPSIQQLGLSMVVMLIAMILGCVVFGKLQKGFAEEL